MKRTHEPIEIIEAGATEDPSWEKFDEFYNENADKLKDTPELFAPPKQGSQVQFLSSKDFDANIPSLCKKICELLEEQKIGRVVLWVDNPRKSNLWVALKCWPFLRDVVDEVRSARDVRRDPYGGRGYSNAHIFLDDAIFTGKQMSKHIIDSYYLQSSYGSNGTDDHLWVVAAMAMSKDAEELIGATLKRGDADYCVDDDPYESEVDVYRKVAFVSEVVLTPDDKSGRILYYTGFKVPDNHSIGLVPMIKNGDIPNITIGDLSMAGITHVKLKAPYHSLELTWKGEGVRQIYKVVE